MLSPSLVVSLWLFFVRGGWPQVTWLSLLEWVQDVCLSFDKLNSLWSLEVNGNECYTSDVCAVLSSEWEEENSFSSSPARPLSQNHSSPCRLSCEVHTSDFTKLFWGFKEINFQNIKKGKRMILPPNRKHPFELIFVFYWSLVTSGTTIRPTSAKLSRSSSHLWFGQIKLCLTVLLPHLSPVLASLQLQ